MQTYGVLYGCQVVLPDGKDITNRNLDNDGYSEYWNFMYGYNKLRQVLLNTSAICSLGE